MTKELIDSPSLLDILDTVVLELTIDLHRRCKGLMRNPLGRCTRSRLFEHAVDLLERQTLGLWDQEVRVDECAGTETTPDEEDGRLEVTLVFTNHVWSNDGNDGVPQPVGSGRETNSTGSDWQWEDLSDENPSSGTPCASEEEDEDGDEGDLGIDGRDVVCKRLGGIGWVGVGVVESNSNTDDGNEKLADEHTERTEDEEGSATELLNSVERDRGRADIDQGEDEGDDEGEGDDNEDQDPSEEDHGEGGHKRHRKDYENEIN